MNIRTYRRGRRWWLDYHWNRARIRVPVADTEQDAKTEAAKIVLAVAQKVFPGPEAWHRGFERPDVYGDMSFRTLAEEYLRLHAAAKKAYAFYDATVTILLRHFKDRPLRSISAKDADTFIAERRREVKVSTANRTLVVAKHMFKKATEWGYVNSNPFARIRAVREQNRREFFLTSRQADALLAELPAHLRPVTIAALHTGARKGELLGLRWSDVDLARAQVTFRNTKNGERRAVPLSETLVATLKALPNRSTPGPVFLNADGLPLTGATLRRPFEEAVVRARLAGFVFHDLRHSAASAMVGAGVPLNSVRAVLGHKSLAMTLRYAHLAPEHLREAADAMDAFAAPAGR